MTFEITQLQLWSPITHPSSNGICPDVVLLTQTDFEIVVRELALGLRNKLVPSDQLNFPSCNGLLVQIFMVAQEVLIGPALLPLSEERPLSLPLPAVSGWLSERCVQQSTKPPQLQTYSVCNLFSLLSDTEKLRITSNDERELPGSTRDDLRSPRAGLNHCRHGAFPSTIRQLPSRQPDVIENEKEVYRECSAGSSGPGRRFRPQLLRR